MNHVDNEVRRALWELVEEGRPVNLGRAALAGARRRRRTHRAVAAVAVAAAAAISLPVMLADQVGTDDHGIASPTPTGAGQSVVTVHYQDDVNAPPLVLNPDTGTYRPADELLGTAIGEQPRYVTVSPDLRQVAAAPNSFRLRIASTTAEGAPESVRLPGVAGDPVWSPDSRRIALTRGSDRTYVDSVVVVEAGTGETTEVTLDFPPNHTGLRAPVDAIAWLDPDHLVVATVDLTDRYPLPGDGAPASGGKPLITGVSVFATDGTLVRQVLIDQSDLTGSDDPHTGRMWAPHGEVRNGRVLLSRPVEVGTLELAVLDLSSGRLVDEPVAATLPAVPLPADVRQSDGWEFAISGSHVRHPAMDAPHAAIRDDGQFQRTPLPAAWLHNGAVLVATGRFMLDGFELPAEFHLVDLSTGQVRPADLPVPASHAIPRVGDAAGLSPESRDRAHRM